MVVDHCSSVWEHPTSKRTVRVCAVFPDRSPPEVPTSTTPFPAAPLFRKHERIDDACRRIITTLDFYSARSIRRIGIPT